MDFWRPSRANITVRKLQLFSGCCATERTNDIKHGRQYEKHPAKDEWPIPTSGGVS